MERKVIEVEPVDNNIEKVEYIALKIQVEKGETLPKELNDKYLKLKEKYKEDKNEQNL